MSEKKRLQGCLIRILASIGFDDRYYSYLATKSSPSQPATRRFSLDEFSASLASTGLEFKFHRKEKFFGHSETTAGYRFVLNALFTDATLELVLGVTMASGEVIGGPYALLARDVRLLSGRSVPEGAPYPKLPFYDQTTLSEAVQLGVSLFKDIRLAILSNQQWTKG
jgi:hypothetical protein